MTQGLGCTGTGAVPAESWCAPGGHPGQGLGCRGSPRGAVVGRAQEGEQGVGEQEAGSAQPSKRVPGALWRPGEDASISPRGQRGLENLPPSPLHYWLELPCMLASGKGAGVGGAHLAPER